MPPTTFDNPFTFGVNLDLSFWGWFAVLPGGEQVRIIFALIGWAGVALVLFYMGAWLWMEYRQETKYTNHWQWVLLAVDIPPLYIQTPKAVEQIFAHLSGAGIHPNIGDKFWHGKRQKWFSLEIISLEGYTQFLIRTEIEFRDLVEAAIYAQYAEAEITEVEDYALEIPRRYPNPDYDVMGVEFKLAADDVYPIRTYEEFEYSISKDLVFSDPMAALLENFSRIGHGENMWLQIIVEPTDSHWKEEGIQLVKKMMGHKGRGEETVTSKLTDLPRAALQELSNIWYWQFEPGEHVEGPSGLDINKLSPGTKATIEAIENKISKIGFKTKIRVLYAARKDIYNPSRCLDGLVGAFNQFHMQNRNAIVPHAKTHAHYDYQHRKSNTLKRRFVQRYQKRKIKAGATPYIMNIEELATIWHFPLPFVKTPLLQKAGAKRGEPPMELPVESSEPRLRAVVSQAKPTPVPTPAVPTEEELPYG
ncbi:MAG: hypothetical protein HYV42_01580 [Candidatus Magasanikbacteria bacterium]|nr:hypothetical protein [Candidatus Magasanikbacteria bacterium]